MAAVTGERLRQWMKWRGWSQAEFAEACGGGTHQATISKLETGARRPGLELAHAIERVTAEPRDDGKRFPAGPILATSWLNDAKPSRRGARPAPRRRRVSAAKAA